MHGIGCIAIRSARCQNLYLMTPFGFSATCNVSITSPLRRRITIFCRKQYVNAWGNRIQRWVMAIGRPFLSENCTDPLRGGRLLARFQRGSLLSAALRARRFMTLGARDPYTIWPSSRFRWIRSNPFKINAVARVRTSSFLLMFGKKYHELFEALLKTFMADCTGAAAVFFIGYSLSDADPEIVSACEKGAPQARKVVFINRNSEVCERAKQRFGSAIEIHRKRWCSDLLRGITIK